MEELCKECNEVALDLEKTQKLGKCLGTAVNRGHAKCVETLIRTGADVNAGLYLYQAADGGHEACVKLLVKAGADVNASQQYNKCTALFRAAIHGHSKCMELIIEAGADVNTGGCVPSLYGVASRERFIPPLHAAIDHKNPECALLLLKAGADVNIRETIKSHATPLMIAAKQGMEDIMRAILDKGADVNAKDKHELTVLSYAAWGGNPECIRRLLAAGADVNGNVPVLFNATVKGCNIEIVKLLLKAGVHVNVRRSLIVNYLPPKKSEISEEIAKLMTAAGEVLDGTAVKTWYYWWDELKQANKELKLKHMCREAIRQHLIDLNRYENLFHRIPKLNLPYLLTKYLLYNTSL